MHTLLIVLYSLLLSANPYKTGQDSFEIKGNGYTGYIMPLEGTESKFDPGNIYYRPSQSEIVLAEKMLDSYLDIF